MGSITNRTLLLLAVGGLLAAIVSAIIVYGFSSFEGQARALDAVSGYADLLADRENERMAGAEAALTKARNSFQLGAEIFVSDEPLSPAGEALFNSLFPVRADNTRRSIDGLFDGMVLPSGEYVSGFAAFMRNGEAVSNRRKRTMLMALQAIKANAGRSEQSFGNLSFVSPDGDILVYGPDYGEAMMLYRRYAPSNFNVFQSGVVLRPDHPSLASQNVYCSDLLGFASRGPRRSPAVTCQLSAGLGGDTLGAFGMTLLVKEVYGKAYDHAVEFMDVFLVSRQGLFATAPKAALSQSLDIIGQPVDKLDHSSANWLKQTALSQTVGLGVPGTRTDDASFFTARRTIPLTGWTMAIVYPQARVQAKALERAAIVFIAGLALTAFVCLLASFALRLGVSGPLLRLAGQADALAVTLKRKDRAIPDFHFPTQRDDEVGALSRSFEALANTSLSARNSLFDLIDSRTAELEEQITVSRQATAVTSDFMTRMSRDVRTHLNAIAGFAQILTNEDVSGISEDHRQHLELIVQNAGALNALLDDLFASTSGLGEAHRNDPAELEGPGQSTTDGLVNPQAKTG